MTREQARASITTRGFMYKTHPPPQDQKIKCTRTEYISIPPTQ